MGKMELTLPPSRSVPGCQAAPGPCVTPGARERRSEIEFAGPGPGPSPKLFSSLPAVATFGCLFPSSRVERSEKFVNHHHLAVLLVMVFLTSLITCEWVQMQG